MKCKWIAVILSVGLLTGCIEIDEDISSSVICEGNFAIDEDAYVACKIELQSDRAIRVAATLISGSSVEAYFMDDSSFDAWKTAFNGQSAGFEFRYYPDFSRVPLATTFQSDWLKVKAGVYYFMIENTDFGKTAPKFNGINDSAWVTYKITAK